MNTKAIAIGVKVASYVEKHNSFPSTITLNNVKYNYGTFNAILADGAVNAKSVLKQKTYNNAPSPQGDKINKTLTRNEYLKLSKEIVEFYNKNKRSPNYAVYQKYKIKPQLYGYCLAKIARFYGKNARLPNTCEFKSSVFNSSTSAKYTTKGGTVCKKLMNICKMSINNYTDVYNAMKKFTYQYYYNDVKPQSKTLSAKAGNCTDLNQIAYAALKELGYTVRIVRGLVRCNDGKTYGHVWCQIKLNSKWTNIDASAAAKGKSLGNVICSKVVEITDINPSWAVSDDGRT